MKKGIITLSMVAAIATSSFADANADMAAQLEMLKKQIAALEAKLNNNTKSIKKVNKLVKKNKKKIKKVSKKANTAKALANNDNLKFSVDFRTAVDVIKYTHASGKTSSNDALLTNRLWLKGAYAPSDNVAFYSTLSYNKVYGATTAQRTNGFESFDWVTNETATTDNIVNVKEAYWLYKNDTFLGSDISWTASIGRRPSTDGLGINYREGDKRKSAIASTVNVEFDGASFRWNLDKVTPLEGSWFKLCMGRGITNAIQRFNTLDGTDYSADEALTNNSDMIGFIFVPYDNGQYSLHTNWAMANHLIGYTYTDITDGDMTNNTFADVGDISLATVVFKADGIGEEISDFLDATTFFASYSVSKTDPNDAVKNNGGMLGSGESQTGHSTWIGVQMPCLISEDGRLGIEWNKGSKYWRSMTYAEDTMIGSKIAARGTAWEVYYNKPLTKSLSASIRYTHIKYDYTGSNAFFGADGTPMTMAEATLAGQDPVEKATDIRAYIRYRY